MLWVLLFVGIALGGLGVLAWVGLRLWRSARGLLDELDVMAGRAGELAEPTAWVFGSEAHGLSDEIKAQLDTTLRVPLYGQAESLNLATAAAVCLYASARAQHR